MRRVGPKTVSRTRPDVAGQCGTWEGRSDPGREPECAGSGPKKKRQADRTGLHRTKPDIEGRDPTHEARSDPGRDHGRRLTNRTPPVSSELPLSPLSVRPCPPCPPYRCLRFLSGLVRPVRLTAVSAFCPALPALSALPLSPLFVRPCPPRPPYRCLRFLSGLVRPVRLTAVSAFCPALSASSALKEHRLPIRAEHLFHGGANLVQRGVRAGGIEDERDQVGRSARSIAERGERGGALCGVAV